MGVLFSDGLVYAAGKLALDKPNVFIRITLTFYTRRFYLHFFYVVGMMFVACCQKIVVYGATGPMLYYLGRPLDASAP